MVSWIASSASQGLRVSKWLNRLGTGLFRMAKDITSRHARG